MSTTAIVNNVLARVRELLRQHDASYTRHALDLLLADLERDLHRDLEPLIAGAIADGCPKTLRAGFKASS